MISSPLGLFYYRWNEWILTLTPTVGVSFKDLYGIMFIIKAGFFISKRPNMIPDFIKRYYKVFWIFVIFLLFWGLSFGHNALSIFWLLKYLPSILLFIIVPKFFGHDELIAFNRIIFLFTVIHTMASFIDIITSGVFIQLFTFGKPPVGIATQEDLIRIIGGIFLAFYSMIIGLFYLATKQSGIKNWYLWLVVLSSWFFILNSATRGWMLASIFLMFSFGVFNIVRNSLNMTTIFSLILLIFLVYIALPGALKQNLNSAFNRFSTIASIAEGDLTVEGTAYRWNVRGPHTLTRFKESPVVGFGYSSVTFDYYDNHVGNHSLLLTGGVIGLIIVWMTVFRIILFLFRLNGKIYESGLFVFGLTLVAIMVIHSTSRGMIGYIMSADSAFFLCLIFNHINANILHTHHLLAKYNKPENLVADTDG